MNAHLIVLVLAGCLFAAAWGGDCKHCEQQRLAAAESRPAVVQHRSAMATLTRNHRRDVLLAKKKNRKPLVVAEIQGPNIR